MVRKERGPWSYALVVLACLGTVPVIFYQGQGVNPTSFHWTATNTEAIWKASISVDTAKNMLWPTSNSWSWSLSVVATRRRWRGRCMAWSRIRRLIYMCFMIQPQSLSAACIRRQP